MNKYYTVINFIKLCFLTVLMTLTSIAGVFASSSTNLISPLMEKVFKPSEPFTMSELSELSELVQDDKRKQNIKSYDFMQEEFTIVAPGKLIGKVSIGDTKESPKISIYNEHGERMGGTLYNVSPLFSLDSPDVIINVTTNSLGDVKGVVPMTLKDSTCLSYIRKSAKDDFGANLDMNGVQWMWMPFGDAKVHVWKQWECLASVDSTEDIGCHSVDAQWNLPLTFSTTEKYKMFIDGLKENSVTFVVELYTGKRSREKSLSVFEINDLCEIARELTSQLETGKRYALTTETYNELMKYIKSKISRGIGSAVNTQSLDIYDDIIAERFFGSCFDIKTSRCNNKQSISKTEIYFNDPSRTLDLNENIIGVRVNRGYEFIPLGGLMCGNDPIFRRGNRIIRGDEMYELRIPDNVRELITAEFAEPPSIDFSIFCNRLDINVMSDWCKTRIEQMQKQADENKRRLQSLRSEYRIELKKKDDLLNMIAICNQYIGTKLKGSYSDYDTYKKCLDKAVDLLEDPLWRELRKTMGMSADSLNRPAVSAIIQNWIDLVNQRLNIPDTISKFEYENDPEKLKKNLDKLQKINVILEGLQTKFHNTANTL